MTHATATRKTAARLRVHIDGKQNHTRNHRKCEFHFDACVTSLRCQSSPHKYTAERPLLRQPAFFLPFSA